MPQTLMAPGDLTLLGLIGKSLEGGIAQLIVSAAFYGAFLLLFSISIITFVLRERRTSASYAILVITIVTFLLATLDLAGRVLSIYFTTSGTLRGQRSDVLLKTKVASTNVKLIVPNIIAEWTTSTATMISDSVVIWRLWIVIPEQRNRATIAMVLFFLLSIGLTLAYLIKISSPTGIMSVYLGGAPYKLFALSIVFSLATNIVTTGIFGFKLWRFRRFLAKNGILSDLDAPGTRKRLENILLILVESGLFYCFVQFVYLVWALSHYRNDAERLAQKIYDVFYFSISVIYPTLVVVCVNTQRSLADRLRKSTVRAEGGSHEVTENHLSFAAASSVHASSEYSNLSTHVLSKTPGSANQTRSAPY